MGSYAQRTQISCGTLAEILSLFRGADELNIICDTKLLHSASTFYIDLIKLKDSKLVNCELNCKVVGWFRLNPDSLLIASPDF